MSKGIIKEKKKEGIGREEAHKRDHSVSAIFH